MIHSKQITNLFIDQQQEILSTVNSDFLLVADSQDGFKTKKITKGNCFTVFGTVTSVAISSTDLSVIGSPITSSGTFTLDVNNNAITNSKLSTVNTATFKGRTTAGTGNVEDLTVSQAKTLLSLSGTNTGDQTITLTGDITGSGTGSFSATIGNSAVTLAKIANIASFSLLGNISASPAAPSALNANQVTGFLNVFTSIDKGLTPASGGGSVNYLRADGTWAIPSGIGTVTSVAIYSTDLSVSGSPITSSGTFTLDINSNAVSNNKLATMATSTIKGRVSAGTGNVEDLTALQVKTLLNLSGSNTGDQTITLTGDITGSGTGSFTTTISTGSVTLAKMANLAANSIIGNNTGISSTPIALTGTQVTAMLSLFDNSFKGLVPVSPGGTSNFLRADGTWAVPPVGGTVSSVAISSTDLSVSGSPITSSGTFALDINLNAVTNTKLAQIVTSTIKGRVTAGTGNVEDLTVSQVKTLLSLTGTNSGDQTITLTGNVTGSGTGSFATTIAAGVVDNSMLSSVATSTFKGRATTGTGNVEDLTVAQAKTLLNLTGTNSGDQTITLTGDVTGTGTGSFATTVSANAVTNAKLATVSTSTFKGRITAGTGNVEDLTATQATSLLNVFTSALNGLVPLSGGGTTTFLRADGTWATISGTGTVTSVAISSTDLSVSGSPITTSGTFTLDINANAVTNAKLATIATSTFKGRVTAGTGNVEDLTATQATALLNVFTSTLKGLVPLSGGGTTTFLRADGTWVAPGGTGTVTSVAISSTDLSVSGSPITSTGTIALDINANAVTNAKLATVATATFKGRTTAGTGNPEDLTVAQAKTLLNLTGTNSGDQTITLTGNVTGSGTGSFAATIANAAVTLAKMANLAANSIIGNNTGAGATPLALTGTQVTAMLDNFTSTLKGLVPASGGSAANFLNGSGAWSAAVTSVAISSTDLSVSGSPITSSGTFTLNINANAVTNAKLATIATATFKGRTTAGTGNVEDLTVAQAQALLNISGTNTGDQTITLTSDVTGSGTGSFATTIAANVVTNAKLAQISTSTFKGRITAATGNVEDLTVAQAKTLLNLTGTNSGDQTITLTGNVTGSGTGSFATTIAANVVSNSNLSQIATATFKGRTTAGTGNVEDLSVSQAQALLNISGTNTGDQTITLTGDVTGSGTGSFATTIASGSVSLAKLSNLAANSIIGNNTGVSAVPLALTGTQVTAMLDNFTSTLKGLVPLSGGGTTNFLRADGAWATPGGGGTVTSVSISSTDLSVSGSPITSSGTFTLDINANAVTNAKLATIATATFKGRTTAGTGNVEDLTVSQAKALLNLTGTNSGDQTITLTGDVTGSGTGSFTATIASSSVTLAKMANLAANSIIGNNTGVGATPLALTGTQVTAMLDNFTSTLKGLVPLSGGGTTTFLRADGAWSSAVTSVAISSTDLSVSGSPVTSSGTFTLDINSNAVTNAKLAQIATATFKGRTTAGTGNVEDLTVAQAKTLLNLTGTNSGDQTITLTGDVTGSGTGSFSTTISNNVVTNSNLAQVATATFKGRTTASTGNVEDLTVAQAKALLNLTGTNSGDQTITLTGDVTGSGTGSFAATIASASVTLAKMANLAANSIIGNNTGSGATPIALTGTQVTAMLDNFTSTLKGLVPLSGGGTTNFLRADGTWAAPSGGGTPGGSTTHVQYNNAGAFAGSANLTFDGTNFTHAGTGTFGTGTGLVSLNGVVKLIAGSAASPAIYVDSDSDTGMYSISANRLGFATGGILRFDVSTTAFTSTVTVVTPAATTSGASFNMPHGTAPTSPVNGDEWTTTVAKYSRINGTTVNVTRIVATLTDAATITVDSALGDMFTVTLGGNRTMGAPSNPINGRFMLFRIRQDATGSRTITWNAAYAFNTALPVPTLSTAANKEDYVGFCYNSTNAKWECLSYVPGHN